ncbi:MAG: hypothetical protein P8184_14815, partial [Calditrichia bacterium]
MKKGMVFLFLLMIGLQAGAQNEREDFYDINLDIRPAAEFLSADVRLACKIQEDGTDSLRFLLHKRLLPELVSGDQLRDFTFDTTSAPFFPFVPEAGTLTLHFSKPFRKGEIVLLHFRYAGKIGILSKWKNNRVTADWIELGLYAPWFPFMPQMTDITYRIKLHTAPGDRIFGPGRISDAEGNWVISSSHPGKDIIVLAAPKDSVRAKILDKGGLRIFCANDLADSTLNDMAQNGVWLLKTYRKWFGAAKTDGVELALVPRRIGGGYARTGFIVFNRFSDSDYAGSRIKYFRFMAHEFAHLWWANAPTDSWEDWLNEAFAEYSALRAVRERLGEDAFDSLYNPKLKEIAGLPPVKGISRSDGKAHDVLYDKGCVLLTELE